MRKTLTAVAVITLGLLARAVLPATAQADEYVGWEDVCCGPSCLMDSCTGNGKYKCCK
jgi:hypothetical protein